MLTETTPDFRQDWGGEVREHWPRMFRQHNITDAPNLRFLEIGCFEGRTTLWLLDNVITDPTSTITVIDTFKGSPEFRTLGIREPFKERFHANVEQHADRVTVWEGCSRDILPTLEPGFDFVFVDGSHVAADVWDDATLAWPLLKSCGLMVFDDYEWGDRGPATPRPAVDRFLVEYADELTVYRLGYQCVVRKR